MEYITISPAYGRDYKSKKAAIEDLKAGKDFIVESVHSPYCGRYCSIRDLKGYQVEIRYNKLRNVCITTVK